MSAIFTFTLERRASTPKGGYVKPEHKDHLFSVYQVERQDDQTALTVAFAIATTGITYVIAATAYIGDRCSAASCDRFSEYAQLIAAAIPISLFGFLVLNVAATRMRSVHLRRLEAILAIDLPGGQKAPYFHTDASIVYRPDDLLTKPRVRLVFAAITSVAYGVVGVILVGFTWFALHFDPWTPFKIFMTGVYAVVELVEILGLAIPLWHPRFRYRAEPGAAPIRTQNVRGRSGYRPENVGPPA
jgi:hypothetical protein